MTEFFTYEIAVLLTFWYVFAIIAINIFISKTVTNNMK